MQILRSADGKKPFEDRTRLGWAPQPFLKVFVLLSLPVMLAGCTSTNAIDVAAKEAALETTDLLKSGPIEPLAAPAALQRLMDASLVKQDALFEGRAALIEASILRRARKAPLSMTSCASATRSLYPLAKMRSVVTGLNSIAPMEPTRARPRSKTSASLIQSKWALSRAILPKCWACLGKSN